MRVATITFHRAVNYGAVLQTYALSRYLMELGYDVQVLDYRADAIENSYKVRFGLNVYSLKRMLLLPFSEMKKKSFYRFVDKNIPHTRPLYTLSDLKEEAKKFEFVVTGSDQVWNSQWTEGDEAYLLNFCKDEQKVSYAASIGKSSISEEEQQRLKKNLKSFRMISVREKTGKDLLDSLIQKDIFVNCDPVALLSKEAWKKVAVLPKESNYILVYMLVRSDRLMDAAVEYGKKMGKQVILINDNIRRQYPVTYKRYISPEQFVGLFCNADAVFTNSFHGTMFSIIFEKEVHVELQKYKGAPNSRFIDLLRAVGMEKCIFDGEKTNDNYEKIMYDSVRTKLGQMKDETKKYFEKAFCGGIY